MNWIELKEKIIKLLYERNLSNPNIRLNALLRLEGIIKSNFRDIYNNPSILLQIDKNKFKEMISSYKKLNSAESSIINNFYQLLEDNLPDIKNSNRSISPKKTERKINNKKPKIVKSCSELSNQIYGLDPIIDDKTIILILGTFPAKESIDANFYYQNQIKRFWGQALKSVGLFENISNEKRKNLLLKKRIGLWDIFECVERPGSNQDKAIKKAKYNNLNSFLDEYPSLEYLVFNGKNAYEWLKEDYLGVFSRDNLEVKRLQSSSGGNGWFMKGKDWEAYFKTIACLSRVGI